MPSVVLLPRRAALSTLPVERYVSSRRAPGRGQEALGGAQSSPAQSCRALAPPLPKSWPTSGPAARPGGHGARRPQARWRTPGGSVYVASVASGSWPARPAQHAVSTTSGSRLAWRATAELALAHAFFRCGARSSAPSLRELASTP
jgi:hypothetical protein